MENDIIVVDGKDKFEFEYVPQVILAKITATVSLGLLNSSIFYCLLVKSF